MFREAPPCDVHCQPEQLRARQNQQWVQGGRQRKVFELAYRIAGTAMSRKN